MNLSMNFHIFTLYLVSYILAWIGYRRSISMGHIKLFVIFCYFYIIMMSNVYIKPGQRSKTLKSKARASACCERFICNVTSTSSWSQHQMLVHAHKWPSISQSLLFKSFLNCPLAYFGSNCVINMYKCNKVSTSSKEQEK